MAKLRSGILGNIRGKVAGVVGGQWKDINYVREYVKPANPNTAAQQTQRTKMADAVAFCKALVGPVFNAYTDKFQKAMSGFNFFVKRNIAEFDGAVDYAALLLTEGKLHAPTNFAAVYDTGFADATLTWDETLGNNGALTDAIFGAIYDAGTGLWYFPAAEGDRDAESLVVPVPSGLTEADLKAYVWAIRYSGTIVDAISSAPYVQAAP